MKITNVFLVAMIGMATPVWAVYAPIPEVQQGETWTISVKGGVTYDSNIFGSSTGAISSYVANVSPKVAYNASLTEQTFFSASYELSVDDYDNRPGSKVLASHALMARLAHQFSKVTTVDVTDLYTITRNPESLLAGLPVNSDQSSKNNEFDLSFTTKVSEKSEVTAKARSTLFRYDNAKLSATLDRAENLYGLSGSYALLPELKVSGEYRHLTVDYSSGGSTKDKSSDYVMAGADYALAKKVSAGGRLGMESRHRDAEASTTVPFVELTGRYDYAQGSFMSAGYLYTLEETSNVAVYTDIQVNRFFANLQHAITPRITASGSVTWEPSTLRGRRGFANKSDDTVRTGAALTWTGAKNWTASLTYDYDSVMSADQSRDMHRGRLGISGAYTF